MSIIGLCQHVHYRLELSKFKKNCVARLPVKREIRMIVRGPGAEPGKWVQSFFLDVFMLYGYCTL